MDLRRKHIIPSSALGRPPRCLVRANPDLVRESCQFPPSRLDFSLAPALVLEQFAIEPDWKIVSNDRCLLLEALITELGLDLAPNDRKVAEPMQYPLVRRPHFSWVPP